MITPAFGSNLRRPASRGAARVTTRREFLRRAAGLAGAAALLPGPLSAADPRATRTAVDQVALGKTGLTLSRLGFGAGTNSGNVQKAIGQPAFNRLIRYAFDQGITYIDCSESYVTFEWIAGAVKGLPREKLFLQSKIPGQPEDVLKTIDRHRLVFNTDYVDSMLIHCMVKSAWTDQWKRVMDGFAEAKDKKWIRAKGVSMHSLPALRAAAASDWPDVNLVRVNPQGAAIDGPDESWSNSGRDIAPVIDEIKKMDAKGHGVIGMKIFGGSGFQTAEDRQKSARFAMSHPEIHAVVIGFKSTREVDEGIACLNRAFAES